MSEKDSEKDCELFKQPNFSSKWYSDNQHFTCVRRVLIYKYDFLFINKYPV